MLSSNVEVFPSQVVASGSVNSSPIKGANLLSISAQIVAVGAGVAGTLKFQCSNDTPITGVAPSHWSDIASQTVSVSAAGTFLIPKFDVCYEYVRLVYTASGSGTISCRIKTLGI